MCSYFQRPIESLNGITIRQATLIKKELKIFTFSDLIQFFPFRYEDRSQINKIKELNSDSTFVQLIGKFKNVKQVNIGKKARLLAEFYDETGTIELIWFQGIQWVTKKINPNSIYLLYGKVSFYNSKINIAHPEIEIYNPSSTKKTLQPVYHSSENLRKRYIDSKFFSRYISQLIDDAQQNIVETLPDYLKTQYNLVEKKIAFKNIHFPKSYNSLNQAIFRLKFEELFYIQLRFIILKLTRNQHFNGFVFNNSSLLNRFYENHLPFPLTEAQKRVIKEIYADFRSGRQMNRLLQGDVGSGKTIVAFLSMLIAISNDTQTLLMAPTEILADQHFNGLSKYANLMGIKIAKLTGSTKQKERRLIFEALQNNELKILVGTHAVLEDTVQFHHLGLAIIDEQHRFGVEQRSKLWKKNKDMHSPHILVMTATPIPRTLALTFYGDLEISVIDELPPGRKPIVTKHIYTSKRLPLFQFIENEVEKGRQVYIVYPLIEESEKLDYNNLMDGYESISRRFKYPISIVHGKMKPKEKEFEMNRFVKNETKIMVATTVIEVGVDVPNASIMVIENAEKFGLSQLHQLRGRVGRGSELSYCFLLSDFKLTNDAKERIEAMVTINDGFKLAELDLKLRGPGDIMGTKQSGDLDLMISNLALDQNILNIARNEAIKLLSEDPQLLDKKNEVIKNKIDVVNKKSINWSKIS